MVFEEKIQHFKTNNMKSIKCEYLKDSGYTPTVVLISFILIKQTIATKMNARSEVKTTLLASFNSSA